MPLLDAIQKKEPMKIGRKTVGEVLTHKNGMKILLVNRTVKDIVRGKNKMISHAMEEDEACWPVESLLLSRMKSAALISWQFRSRRARRSICHD